MKRIVAVVVLAAVAFPAAASAENGWQWNAKAAEASVEKYYRTVDPWALESVNPSGILGVKPDPKLVALAKRAALVDWASCVGRGPHQGKMYGRFTCTVFLFSVMTNYKGAKAITVIPTGRYSFRTLNGWH